MWVGPVRRLRDRVVASHHSGTLYLVGMGASAVGAGVLYIQQEQEAKARRQLHREFDVLLSEARIKARADVETEGKRLKDMPALWTGVLTTVDHRLQGHVMLRGCRVGQTVDVLEEGVGASSRYVTVIDRETGAHGLHLAEWIERAPR